MVYKWLSFLIFLYAAIAFCVGITPFEDTLLEKDFLPDGSVLKYTTISAIMIAILAWLGVSFKSAWTPCSKTANRVLLTNA